MELARDRFNIPMVLEPEYLASPYLDELSGMTYLSYFMKEKSPGTKATLNWVNSQLKNHTVSNFTVSTSDTVGFQPKSVIIYSLICILDRLERWYCVV